MTNREKLETALQLLKEVREATPEIRPAWMRLDCEFGLDTAIKYTDRILGFRFDLSS